MAAVARGGDRQELHERIRQHSQAVTAELKAGAERNSLFDRLRADPAFASVDLASVSDPARFVGRAPEQVDEFLTDVIAPIRVRHPEALGQAAQVSV
jgi:adenylosuccinate lyase